MVVVLLGRRVPPPVDEVGTSSDDENDGIGDQRGLNDLLVGKEGLSSIMR
jgi:hypothetical protein